MSAPLLLWLVAQQPEPPRESLAPRVAVTEERDAWRLAGQKTRVTLRKADLATRSGASTRSTAFRVTFTGMRVTRHDGRSQHPLVGVKPDIPVEPTLAGPRAGRDEVLERALVLARENR